MRSSARATLKNPTISLLTEKNWEVQPKTSTQKIPNLNLWMNWENLCNLCKIGNLHKTRLFTFQI